jgi:hypothetical protein
MLDPDADLGRRAWLRCSRCPTTGCSACAARRTCDWHWCYLLACETRLVFLQCPECRYRWWYDTECGVGDYQPERYQLPDFPPIRAQAA